MFKGVTISILLMSPLTAVVSGNYEYLHSKITDMTDRMKKLSSSISENKDGQNKNFTPSANEEKKDSQKVMADKQAAESKAKADREAAIAKAMEERQAAESKAKADREAAIAKAMEERQAAEAKAKADREAAIAKAMEERQAAEAKAKAEQEAVEAKAKAEQEAAIAKAEDEKVNDLPDASPEITNQATENSQNEPNAFESPSINSNDEIKPFEESDKVETTSDGTNLDNSNSQNQEISV